jgi:fucose permease
LAGNISLIIYACTVVASLLSTRAVRRFHTVRVTIASLGMTALALLGISFAASPVLVCLCAIPLGLGGGSIDVALSNYVALHYKARHLNWLHCFWGLGASLSSFIMSACIAYLGGWRMGYRTVALLQLGVVLALILSRRLWQAAPHAALGAAQQEESAAPLVTNRQALKRPGVKHAMLALGCMSGLESSAGTWIASYLVTQKGLDSATAAAWAALYFGAITVGRMLAGLVSNKLRGQSIIRLGCCVAAAGIVLLLLPLPTAVGMLGFLLTGLGVAPFFPAMLHETPARFGKPYARAGIGLQMATANVGVMLLPSCVGLLAARFSLAALPWVLVLLAVGALWFSERCAAITAPSGPQA